MLELLQYPSTAMDHPNWWSYSLANMAQSPIRPDHFPIKTPLKPN